MNQRPPFETTPAGTTWCTYHGQVGLVDGEGNPAAAGLCEVCFRELHDPVRYTSCGEHGIQPKVAGIDGCSVCEKLKAGKSTVRPRPPAEAFGDTESEPERPVMGQIEEETPLPNAVEAKFPMKSVSVPIVHEGPLDPEMKARILADSALGVTEAKRTVAGDAPPPPRKQRPFKPPPGERPVTLVDDRPSTFDP